MPYNFNTITITTNMTYTTGGQANQWGNQGGQVPNYGTFTFTQNTNAFNQPNTPPPNQNTNMSGWGMGGGNINPGTGVLPGGVDVSGDWRQQLRDRAAAASQKKTDEEYARREYEWNTYRLPEQEAFARQIEQEAMDEANRAMADAAARYGWQRSAGAGTAGMWEMGQYNLQSKAMQLRSNLASINAQYMREVKTAWNNSKDNQAFQKELAALQAAYRERYAEQVAELNDSSWWSKLGSVVGIMLAQIPGLGEAIGGALGIGYEKNKAVS